MRWGPVDAAVEPEFAGSIGGHEELLCAAANTIFESHMGKSGSSYVDNFELALLMTDFSLMTGDTATVEGDSLLIADSVDATTVGTFDSTSVAVVFSELGGKE